MLEMLRLPFSTLLAGLLVTAYSVPAQQSHGSGARPMYHAPRWSPDGNSIVVVAMSAAGSRVLIIPAAGGEPATIPTGRIEPMAADWTTTGRIILVGDSAGGPSRSFVLDRDGKHLRPFHRDSVARRHGTVVSCCSSRRAMD